MFNPNAQAVLTKIGNRSVVIVDDVLADPDALVETAWRNAQAFTEAPGNAFPGPELPLPDSGVEAFAKLLAVTAAPLFGLEAIVSAHARLSMVTRAAADLQPIQRVCHRDRLEVKEGQGVVAGVLYLFNRTELGGTNFFTARDPQAIDGHMARWAQQTNEAFSAETGLAPGYMTDSNLWFECQGHVPARYNRMIWYDGSQFHGSHIQQPELLSADPSVRRLTLNVFAVCEVAQA
jgi:hypothetical protein